MKFFSGKSLFIIFIASLLTYCTAQEGVKKWKWYETSVQSQTVGDYFIPRDHARFQSNGLLDSIWIPWSLNKGGEILYDQFWNI